MERKYVLYEHRNKVNGKRYIGISSNLERRWRGNGCNYKGSPLFYNAIKKHGWDTFSHRILMSGLSEEQANDLEIFYINKFKTNNKKFGYNIAPGGYNHPFNPYKYHTAEAKAKISKANKGKKRTEEWKRQHSERMKGLLVGSKNGKSTPVRCINTGEVFGSQRQAAKAMGVVQAKISRCCNGQANHTHGLRWEYVDKSEE